MSTELDMNEEFKITRAQLWHTLEYIYKLKECFDKLTDNDFKKIQEVSQGTQKITCSPVEFGDFIKNVSEAIGFVRETT